MPCNTYNFNITKGCSFTTILNIQNNDGTYINLSGFSARGYVKLNYGDTGFLYNLNPQTSQPLISGTLLVSGSSQSTSGLIPGQFSYDIEIFDSGSYALKVLNGDFNIHPSTSYN